MGAQLACTALASKYSHLSGIAWMKHMFAKQELFSVLCIRNSCEPRRVEGYGSEGLLTKL